MAEDLNTDMTPVTPRSRDSKLPKKRVFIILCVIVGLLVVGGGAIAAWQLFNKDDDTSSTGKPKVATPKNNAELVDGVNQYVANGDYESAQKVISLNPELAKSRDGKMTLASIYYNQQKLDEALTAYQDIAKEFGWTANLAHLVAGIYVEKNNKEQAIAHYQKEIELLKADTKDPLSKSQITLVENKIKALQQ